MTIEEMQKRIDAAKASIDRAFWRDVYAALIA